MWYILITKWNLVERVTMITICNLRKEKPKYSYDVLVDRTTPLGNPYTMNEYVTRDKVCVRYEKWFCIQLRDKEPEFMRALARLEAKYQKYHKLRLFCWCSPLRCHAETLRTYLKKGGE